MSLITQSTNVLVPPFSRDLGGNTYQYETRAIGGRTRRKRSKYARKSKRSKSRSGGRSQKRSLKK
jgi:hypothetical protein